MACELSPVTIAEAFARRAHAVQVDWNGEPYVRHPERVASILCRRWPDATSAEIQAAWLHDVLEDTATTPADLLAAGISPEAVTIVELLTHSDGMAYDTYIQALAASGNRSAVRVKLADNEDNSAPDRQRTARSQDMVERRYKPARQVLLRGLKNDDN